MALVFIASTTASNSATLEFTSGIDSTYNEYQFYFVNIDPTTSGQWSFQVNAAGGSGFNETMTTTNYRAYIDEAGNYGNIEYQTSSDQAQGTAYQRLTVNTEGTDTDGSASGMLTLYDPSSTTYVKHFVATTADMYDTDSQSVWHVAGYINTTAAIDEISFKFHSGNIDAGTIYMYGVG